MPIATLPVARLLERSQAHVAEATDLMELLCLWSSMLGSIMAFYVPDEMRAGALKAHAEFWQATLDQCCKLLDSERSVTTYEPA